MKLRLVDGKTLIKILKKSGFIIKRAKREPCAIRR